MEWVNYNNYNIIIWNKKTVIRITRSERFLNVYSWPSSPINKIYIYRNPFMCRVCSLPSITENNSVYQGLIKRRRDQGFKIYKLKGNLSWLRVLLTVCNLFSINDLFILLLLLLLLFYQRWDWIQWSEYCMLISVLNLNIQKIPSRRFKKSMGWRSSKRGTTIRWWQ